MKQVGQQGAFGVFSFSKAEEQALDVIKNVFDETRARNRNLTKFYLMEAYQREQKTVSEAVQVLMPSEIVLRERSDMLDISDDPDGTNYVSGPRGRVLSFNGGSSVYNGNVIIADAWPGQRQHYLSFLVNTRKPNLKDDLVNIWGKAFTPLLYGLQPSLNVQGGVEYGFPQVHQFKEINELYKKANQFLLSGEPFRSLGGQLKRLEELIRKDYDDPALTEIREQMYQRKLTELLLSGPK